MTPEAAAFDAADRAKLMCMCGHVKDAHAHPGSLGTPCTQCGCRRFSCGLVQRDLYVRAFLAGTQWQKEQVAQRSMLADLAEPDNHHNALACAYCNPKGLTIEELASGKS